MNTVITSTVNKWNEFANGESIERVTGVEKIAMKKKRKKVKAIIFHSKFIFEIKINGTKILFSICLRVNGILE